MRLRTGLLLAIAAVLGAATVILPAIASSETPPTISAYTYERMGSEVHYWLPETAQVGEGGTVRFTNPSSEVRHGLDFTGGPAKPNCTGLPAGATEATGAISWQAECSFTAPGVYSFICTVHPSEMKGTVTVSASGTTTTTTTTPAGTTTTTSGGPAPVSGPTGTTTVPLLVGPAAGAFGLVRYQRGHLVRGSLELAPADRGATLGLELLARLGGREVPVGRLTRAALPGGRVSFAVALDARGRRLQRGGRALTLLLRITLSRPGTTTLTLARTVSLRA